MRPLVLLLLLLVSTLATAKHFSYDQVHQMPRSIEKDYYIWRLLTQKQTSKAEAQKIIKEAKRLSPKLKKAYRKKTGKKAPVYRKKQKTKPLSAKAKAALKRKQQHAKALIRSKQPFQAWLKESSKSKIFIFLNVGKSGRKLLNHPLPESVWRELSTHASFNSMLKKIRNEGLTQLKKSFLFLPPSKHALNYSSLNYLAFHALNLGKPDIASRYFVLSAQKAREREAVDRALFWAYMTSKKTKYLKQVTKSYDINLYTLLARDFLKLKYPKVIVPSLPQAKLLSKKEVTDPIYWAKLKRKIFSKKSDLNRLAAQYRSEETIGYYSYIKTKASREKEQYFPMPYRTLLSKLPKTRQAIMYAIARQESRFIPGAVSSSYGCRSCLFWSIISPSREANISTMMICLIRSRH